MDVAVRKLNLENLTQEGIPKDFADVQDYFNEALRKNSLPWIPRKTPITDKEILEKWVPSQNINLSLVAESEGKVVGLSTVLYDPKSNDYEFANQRKSGELNSTIDPNQDYIFVQTKLLEGIISELKIQNKTAHCYLPIESPANEAFKNLRKIGNIGFLESYKTGNLSGKVQRYDLP